MPQGIQIQNLAKSIIIPKSNMAFMIFKEAGVSSKILGMSFPLVFNCDGCPFCSGPSKNDCGICKEPDELWINSQCVKCPRITDNMPNKSQVRPECFMARDFTLQGSKNFGWTGGKIKLGRSRILSDDSSMVGTHLRKLQTREALAELELSEWNWFDVEFQREESISVELSRHQKMGSQKWKEVFAL